MNPKALLFVALIVIAPLSGCLEEDAGGSSASSSSSATTSNTGATTPANGSQSTATNQPPIVLITVLSNGTEVEKVNDSYAVVSGQDVTLDASASRDPEGLNLTFLWEFPDGNSSDEAAPNVTFVAGNQTVNLTVADPSGAQSNASLFIVASAGGPSVESKTFEGTILLGTQGDGFVYTTCAIAYAEGEGDIDAVEFDWDLSAASVITQFTMKVTQGDTGVDLDYYLYGPDGKEVAKSAGFEILEGAEKGFTKDGEFAGGAYTVVVRGCTAVDAEFTVEMTATLVRA